MPSDVFWTGFFTFGGGILGAVGTYFGVKSQADLQRGQLELDALRYDGDESSRKRQEDAAAREKRRTLYLNYLGAVDTVVHATAVSDISVDALAERWAAFVKADDEIELGGTDEVKDASYPMHTHVREVGTKYAAICGDPGASWPSDALAWLKNESRREERNDTRAALVAAMRNDLHST